LNSQEGVQFVEFVPDQEMPHEHEGALGPGNFAEHWIVEEFARDPSSQLHTT
jgi:hypothetical protein